MSSPNVDRDVGRHRRRQVTRMQMAGRKTVHEQGKASSWTQLHEADTWLTTFQNLLFSKAGNRLPQNYQQFLNGKSHHQYQKDLNPRRNDSSQDEGISSWNDTLNKYTVWKQNKIELNKPTHIRTYVPYSTYARSTTPTCPGTRLRRPDAYKERKKSIPKMVVGPKCESFRR